MSSATNARLTACRQAGRASPRQGRIRSSECQRAEDGDEERRRGSPARTRSGRVAHDVASDARSRPKVAVNQSARARCAGCGRRERGELAPHRPSDRGRRRRRSSAGARAIRRRPAKASLNARAGVGTAVGDRLPARDRRRAVAAVEPEPAVMRGTDRLARGRGRAPARARRARSSAASWGASAPSKMPWPCRRTSSACTRAMRAPSPPSPLRETGQVAPTPRSRARRARRRPNTPPRRRRARGGDRDLGDDGGGARMPRLGERAADGRGEARLHRRVARGLDEDGDARRSRRSVRAPRLAPAPEPPSSHTWRAVVREPAALGVLAGARVERRAAPGRSRRRHAAPPTPTRGPRRTAPRYRSRRDARRRHARERTPDPRTATRASRLRTNTPSAFRCTARGPSASKRRSK